MSENPADPDKPKESYVPPQTTYVNTNYTNYTYPGQTDQYYYNAYAASQYSTLPPPPDQVNTQFPPPNYQYQQPAQTSVNGYYYSYDANGYCSAASNYYPYNYQGPQYVCAPSHSTNPLQISSVTHDASKARSESRSLDSKESKPDRKRRDYKRRYSRSRSRSRHNRSKSKRSRSKSRRAETRSKSHTRHRDRIDSFGNERDNILAEWRRNFCSTSEEISTKLEELANLNPDEILEREKSVWTRTTPADLYYVRDEKNPKVIIGTEKLADVCNRFNEDLVLRAQKVNATKPKYELPKRKRKTRMCKHKSEQFHHSDSSSSSEEISDEEENIMEELSRKQQHPDRLHPEMWYNDPGEMNDGPLCRCSPKSRKSGIRHGIYAGEKFLLPCDKNSNNFDKLYHYRITISPPTNFLTKTPTIIKYDEHEFIFEGFSMFSHFPLVKLPTCKVIRFNIEYTILYIEEKFPDNFTINELDLFHDFLFRELLELVDLDFRAAGDTDGCSQFHFMPRFVRELPDNGREILSMKEVIQYLINNSKPLILQENLPRMLECSQYEWQSMADEIKGMVVTFPGKKPCSVRVDQLDRNSDQQLPGRVHFPEIVHFGIRPPQLSYAGNPEYQKAWRDYVKFRHLLANMSKPTFEDKRKLEAKENKLQEMRTQSKMKRDVTVAVSAEGFYRTGIMCDVVQHAMLIPVLVCHLRFHHSLNILEQNIDYMFYNRALLQLALTHPSYRENFGTNPDHARNSLTNCGIRQPEYGDRRIHYMNTRKRGINTLINIMSRFGKKHETESNITHNERLEFLGDAVVEFLSSIHLFRMFPELEEGGLATYRAAIVQNQHLAVLARTLNLDQYMLYAHGSDLCHDLELRHAMANCFEALMGALFLDGGIEVADKVFGTTLFKNDPDRLEVWENLPPHPLQEQEPLGDRRWIQNVELLQKLTKFEESIGVEFKHIRLLARAFTDRSIGYTNLTLGSNQRLEFLGDTVLQLIASEYLYKFFPEHHEGHLSLLRSSLVNNRTQSVVCDDLGMTNYAVYNNPKAELKTKDRADLLEAFVGALYIDQGLEFCRLFCQVTLFPRLQDFIMNQDWNDPKSKLQQCCLTLRTMDGGEPDIPVYKVIECKGPTNTRVYTVAVYFRGRRLAKATGHSIQQAEMNSAKKALEISQDLFPQLDHQKRVIAKSMKKQKYPHRGQKDIQSGSEDDNESSVGDATKTDHKSSKRRRSNSVDPKRKRKHKSRRRSRSASKESTKDHKSKSDKHGSSRSSASKSRSSKSHKSRRSTSKTGRSSKSRKSTPKSHRSASKSRRSTSKTRKSVDGTKSKTSSKPSRNRSLSSSRSPSTSRTKRSHNRKSKDRSGSRSRKSHRDTSSKRKSRSPTKTSKTKGSPSYRHKSKKRESRSISRKSRSTSVGSNRKSRSSKPNRDSRSCSKSKTLRKSTCCPKTNRSRSLSRKSRSISDDSSGSPKSNRVSRSRSTSISNRKSKSPKSNIDSRSSSLDSNRKSRTSKSNTRLRSKKSNRKSRSSKSKRSRSRKSRSTSLVSNRSPKSKRDTRSHSAKSRSLSNNSRSDSVGSNKKSRAKRNSRSRSKKSRSDLRKSRSRSATSNKKSRSHKSKRDSRSLSRQSRSSSVDSNRKSRLKRGSGLHTRKSRSKSITKNRGSRSHKSNRDSRSLSKMSRSTSVGSGRKSRSPIFKRNSRSSSAASDRDSRSLLRKSRSPSRKSRSPSRKSRSLSRKSRSPSRKSRSLSRKSRSLSRKSRSLSRKSRSTSVGSNRKPRSPTSKRDSRSRPKKSRSNSVASDGKAPHKSNRDFGSSSKKRGSKSPHRGSRSRSRKSRSTSIGFNKTSRFSLSKNSRSASVESKSSIYSKKSRSSIDRSKKSRSPIDRSNRSRSPTDRMIRSRSPIDRSIRSRSPIDRANQSRSPIDRSNQSGSPIDRSNLSRSPVGSNRSRSLSVISNVSGSNSKSMTCRSRSCSVESKNESSSMD